MRVLVCGGRDFRDYKLAQATLDGIHKDKGPIKCIIHGKAPGADTLGAQWASHMGINSMGFNAHWGLEGPAAGPIRNAKMLKEGKPDLVLAFHGGAGTRDMVSKARRSKVPVIVIPATPTPTEEVPDGS